MNLFAEIYLLLRQVLLHAGTAGELFQLDIKRAVLAFDLDAHGNAPRVVSEPDEKLAIPIQHAPRAE